MSTALKIQPEEMDVATFGKWLMDARQGECVEYYRGCTTHMQAGEKRVPSTEEQRAAVAAAWAAYWRPHPKHPTDVSMNMPPLVLLTQRRNGPFDFSYLATRTAEGAKR